MASTAFAVVHAGATPVFADVDARAWTLDADAVRRVLTQNTKAIMPVSLFGAAPDMDALMQVAREHGLFVLEDAAECFLGTYGGRTIGTIGDAGSYSLQSSKHLTSGEGGVIVTDDEDLADRIRRFSGLGYAALGATTGKIARETIQDPDYIRHVSVGFNYRMPELCAAVALAQTERIDELVAVRVRAAESLNEAASTAGWLTPQTVLPGSRHTYWSYAVALDHPDITWHEFRDAFVAEGGDGIYAAWRLNYREPAFEDLAEGVSCPVAERLQSRLLAFKTNYWSEVELEEQAEALTRTIQHFA
jgi:perosamine synthetase